MLNKTIGMILSTWRLYWFKNSCSIPLGLLIHASPTYFLFINTTYTNDFYVLSFWWKFFCLLCINQLLSLILLKLLWALQLVLQPMVPSWVRYFCTEMLVPQKRRKRSRTRRRGVICHPQQVVQLANFTSSSVLKVSSFFECSWTQTYQWMFQVGHA